MRRIARPTVGPERLTLRTQGRVDSLAKATAFLDECIDLPDDGIERQSGPRFYRHAGNTCNWFSIGADVVNADQMGERSAGSWCIDSRHSAGMTKPNSDNRPQIHQTSPTSSTPREGGMDGC